MRYFTTGGFRTFLKYGLGLALMSLLLAGGLGVLCCSAPILMLKTAGTLLLCGAAFIMVVLCLLAVCACTMLCWLRGGHIGACQGSQAEERK